MPEGRAPLQPQPVSTPLGDIPSTVLVTAQDAEMALAIWDRDMGSDYAGLLDATPTGG